MGLTTGLLGALFVFLSLQTAHGAGACAKNQAKDSATCLACNCYYEARGEGTSGMEAVTKVVMTRTQIDQYPSTPCQVVYQNAQFSWTGKWVGRGGRRGRRWVPHTNISAVPAGHECHKIAKKYLEWEGIWADSFYNPALASPRWANRCEEILTVLNHRFMNCTGVTQRAGRFSPQRGAR